MLKGIFLVGWDNMLGSIIEAQYPDNSQIDKNKISQYLATLQALGTSPTLEIKDENQIVLIYGFPVRDGIMNYDFIVAVLDETDTVLINKLQMELKIQGDSILQMAKDQRNQCFYKFAKNIIEPKIRKIVFMGYPNSGKTSTKQFIFDKITSEDLLNTSLSPTEAFETSHYDLIDLQLSVFDTSGQEIERWLDPDENLLQYSDLIIFFISVEDWTLSSEKLLDTLSRLIRINQSEEKICPQIVIFCHKFDLVADFPDFDQISLQEFAFKNNIPIFFTSLQYQGNQDLIIGTQLILDKFSLFFNFFSELFQMLADTSMIQPLFLLDKDFDIASLFTTDNKVLDEINSLKSYILKLLMDHKRIFGEKGDYFTFSLDDGHRFIVILDASIFHPDLSYIVIQVYNFEELDQLNRHYAKISHDFRWKSHQIS
ncbi:hypothetical protein NEF87_001696 [Candidatus Lokiarchaeum ossiferum]|uniref:GTP-binding protein n=1 Tax=Candidatus Lokiarchaeum ossiferum TaxID=2951803 RepID=A0ABY6HPQ6_9ARCH|nr:hypothetical protein NEF87_001696 [Candidatus Lokiarchaeum sp. B-35]